MHWNVPDPAEVGGNHNEKVQAYMDVAVTLKRRIELMLALPMSSLDAVAIHREISEIGKSGNGATATT